MSRGAGDRPLTYKGAWAYDQTYRPRDVVTVNSIAYMAVARTTGVEPEASAVAELAEAVATAVILTSPDGTEWALGVTDAGVTTWTEVT